jgi:hypothetical protein
MNLTPAQITTVKDYLLAHPEWAGEQAQADALNAVASPDYKVWRSALGKHDLIELPDLDSTAAVTTFAIGGGAGSFVDRTVGERDGWRELFNSTLSCKPYLPNVRIAFFDVFSGAGGLSAPNRKHFWARGQRPATVLEKLLAVATVGGPRHDAANGNSPAGQTGTRGAWTNPDTLATGTDGRPVEGAVTADDVVNILR